MLRKLTIFIILAAFLIPVGIGFAQDDDVTPTAAYGDEIAGEITNRNFDQEYFFEGTEGDVIVITLMRASNTADFDPLLYLTTVDNEIIAQNDDFSDLDSRIIARLPATDTYQIVATRLGERTGSGSGAFTLTLDQAQPFASGTVVEGTVDAAGTPPSHIFVPSETGVYTITYNRVSGDYFPVLVIQRLVTDSTYSEEVGRISAATLYGGSLTMEVDPEAIYILSFEPSYYSYDYEAQGTAVYTITVEETTVPESETPS